jgi:uncharacterized protein DUF5648
MGPDPGADVPHDTVRAKEMTNMAAATAMPHVDTRRLACLVTVGLIAALLVLRPLPARAATYDPLNVICYETYRGSSSMSTADIQAFLDTLSGPLKSLIAKDHNGVKKPASRIISEAARAWNMNPKVILATLQKEQSLLTVSNSINSARYRKAMGCGVYGADPDNPGKTLNRFPGFGNQIWNGARLLATYEISRAWTPASTIRVTARKTVTATKTVDGQVVSYKKTVSYRKTIKPKNASTFALYTYTPYYPQTLVWDIYVRYFGDPQTPSRMRPVYRFRASANGTYYYTQSEAKRYTMVRTASRKWIYGGVAFTVDTSAAANAAPLYRLYNESTRRYFYTTSVSRRDELLNAKPRVWTSNGTVCLVSTDATGAAPVFGLRSKTTKATYYTPSSSLKKKLSTGTGARFSYTGVAFYLGASEQTTTPVGPAALN